jgi:hypothetical protein
MNQPDGGYEFSDGENFVIRKLARRMRTTGIIQTVVGVLMVCGFAGRSYALRQASPILTFGVDLPLALGIAVGGVLLALAAPPFLRVVETQGNDIDHVMDACGKLSRLMLALLVAFALAMIVWLGVFIVLAIKGTPLVATGS